MSPDGHVAAEPERATGTGPLAVQSLGRVAYEQAWEAQRRLVEARLRGEAPDTLVVCEHEPVITVGRGTRGAFLNAARFDVVEVERGGQATYHGPGQIVIYPIVALTEGARDLHRWMRALESAAIAASADCGLTAGRREGATGVWIDGARKLVSIGVAARRWVTWHGLAFNHDPDLSHFAAILPCGLPPSVMTSLAVELGDGCPSMERTTERLVARLQQELVPFREPGAR